MWEKITNELQFPLPTTTITDQIRGDPKYAYYNTSSMVQVLKELYADTDYFKLIYGVSPGIQLLRNS